MTEYERESKLSAILASYAKNNEEQEAIYKMIADKATPKDYVIALADGLMYGNWPWVNHKTIAQQRYESFRSSARKALGKTEADK